MLMLILLYSPYEKTISYVEYNSGTVLDAASCPSLLMYVHNRVGRVKGKRGLACPNLALM